MDEKVEVQLARHRHVSRMVEVWRVLGDAERAEQFVAVAPQTGRPALRRGWGSSTRRSRMILPSSITSTRSASTSASSTSCVTSSTAGRWIATRSKQQRVHPDARQRVERAERLVRQEQRRLAHQRARQRHALLLAARKRVRPGILAAGQADIGERRPPPLGRIRMAQADGDVLQRVSQGSSRESWNSTDRFSGTSMLPCPSTSSSSAASARSSVLLPEPLRPISATNSPAAMSSETSSSTTRPENARVRLRSAPRRDAPPPAAPALASPRSRADHLAVGERLPSHRRTATSEPRPSAA